MASQGKAKDHSAKFYVSIWIVLMVLIGISVGVGQLGHPWLGTAFIFGIAFFKAFLVGTQYMGLAWEPGYISWIMVVGVIFLAILFLGLIPDMVYVYGRE